MVTGQVRADTVVADSFSEFSASQGQNNWYYGYENGAFSAYTANNFQQMQFYSPGAWHAGSNSSNPWTQLWADGGHPNGTDTGNLNQMAVRRWVSEVSGVITLTGDFKDTNPASGNGVQGGIYVNGTQVWLGTISNGGGTTFSFSTAVKAGQAVDFVLDPNGNDYADSTRFTAQITTPVPEPETSAMMLAGLGLLGFMARRRQQKLASA